MRPVNLLPGEHRPRRGSGSRSGGAYVVVGVLGAMLVMALVYVLTANQVSSRQEATAEAESKAAAAQNEVAQLGAFGSFAQIKAVRVTSVKSLAQARFDWERFLRELAHVTPASSWFTEVDAATSDSARSGGAGTAPAASSSAQAGPSAKLSGCAPSQPDVAKLMVRARELHRVTDVQLLESKEQDSGSAGTAAAPTGATGGGGECPDSYKSFNVTVIFDQLPPAASGGPERVPASLGGGS